MEELKIKGGKGLMSASMRKEKYTFVYVLSKNQGVRRKLNSSITYRHETKRRVGSAMLVGFSVRTQPSLWSELGRVVTPELLRHVDSQRRQHKRRALGDGLSADRRVYRRRPRRDGDRSP